jgi:hypothetical protein
MLALYHPAGEGAALGVMCGTVRFAHHRATAFEPYTKGHAVRELLRHPGRTLLGLVAGLSVVVPAARGQSPGGVGDTDPSLSELSQTQAAALTPPEHAEHQAFADEERADPLNLYAGVDFTSMYVSRGQVYSSKFSVQPWIELDLPLRDGRSVGPFDSLSVFVGNWNSLQEGDAGLGQARSGELRLVDNWYETDLYTGVRVTRGNVASSLRLNYYTSPSDSFEDIYELDLRLSYDDGDWWGEDTPFRLNPSIRIAKELRDKAGTERWFFRPQIEPSYTFRLGDQPITATVPLVLGFGADGQYVTAGGEERHFGYFQTGLKFTGPLDVLPENTGSLSWSAGVDLIVVTDESLNFRGDTLNPVATFGIAYSY